MIIKWVGRLLPALLLWLSACSASNGLPHLRHDPSMKTRVESRPAAQAVAPENEVRALWVTRWDYRSSADVRKIVTNAKWLGCNRLFFQVRGEGTCFFPSAVEPWAWELSGGGPENTGKDPGWDPLRAAIDAAHGHDMELHAYLNVLPSWKRDDPPPRSSGQVYVAHPEWNMVDRRGHPMAPKKIKFYAFLNPALPEVQAYLSRLFGDLARRYPDLDGVHLDYIRYPGEVGDYSYDRESLRRFSAYSGGRHPDDLPKHWKLWRANQIKLLLVEISRAMKAANRELEISAAVVANLEEATHRKLQYWWEWPDAGLVDSLAPMAYHYDMAKYRQYLETTLKDLRPQRGKVIVGLWPAKKWEKKGMTPNLLQRQVNEARRAGADGIALFAYSRFFPGHQANSWAWHVRKNCFN